MNDKIHPVSGFLIVICIVISGCSYTSTINPPAVSPGNNLQITKSFQALSNGSHVYFQNGVNLPSRQVDKWSTYCRLYVYSDQHEADYITSVQPGFFHISSTAKGREVVKNPDQLNESTRVVAALEWDNDHLPSFVLYRIDMQLHSPEQPDVRSLSCYQKSSTYGDYHPRRAQINQALGDLIKITDDSV